MAERLARDHPQGAIFANQFDNIANRDVHVRTTGPEIWAQTDGTVDGFVSAVGTGGTLAGTAIALRARKPGIAIAIADVPGAALYS
jgi:cysteine synthase A